MKIGLKSVTFGASAIAALAFASPASAQATRTWVSGVGDDVNPCSRTAPCKTFAGAISKTAAGGEINCLDPGGYGTLTITKSITVDCTGTFGSTLNSGGINGFVINDSLTATPGTIEVRLRGLSINGAGSTPGLNGIRFVSGKSLVVENVFIQNQKSGSGISIAPSAGAAKVDINHVTIVDSGTATGAGIEIKPTGTANALVSVRNVKQANSLGPGLRADSTATTGNAVSVSIEDSQFAGNNAGITSAANSNPSTVTVVFLNDSEVFDNTSGLVSSGSSTRVRVSNSGIISNSTGLSVGAGSFINDLGGNRLVGNATPGAFN